MKSLLIFFDRDTVITETYDQRTTMQGNTIMAH